MCAVALCSVVVLLNRVERIININMPFIYQITDWKKSFYFISKSVDPAKPLLKYEEKYDIYKNGNGVSKNGKVLKRYPVFDIFDSDDYCILLVCSAHPGVIMTDKLNGIIRCDPFAVNVVGG